MTPYRRSLPRIRSLAKWPSRLRPFTDLHFPIPQRSRAEDGGQARGTDNSSARSGRARVAPAGGQKGAKVGRFCRSPWTASLDISTASRGWPLPAFRRSHLAGALRRIRGEGGPGIAESWASSATPSRTDRAEAAPQRGVVLAFAVRAEGQQKVSPPFHHDLAALRRAGHGEHWGDDPSERVHPRKMLTTCHTTNPDGSLRTRPQV